MSNETLSFKTVAVTGALGGIGKEVIRTLHELGAHVIAIDLLDSQEGNRIFKEFVPNNGEYICSDLNQESSEASLQAILAKSNYPDAVVSLAGIVVSGNLVDQSNSDIDRVLSTNLNSQMKLTREVIKHWIANKTKGQMIYVSSWVDHVPWPGISPYAASKAGLHAFARGVARENARYGIRANVISPGIVDVGMAAKQWREEPDYRARASRAIPLGRLQTPKEVADGIAFLLSKNAEYMTGSNLLIDGGASLYPMDPEEVL